jgi:hypothetical protein
MFWKNHRWRAVVSAVAVFTFLSVIADIPAVAGAIGGASSGSDLFTPTLGQAFVQSLMVGAHGSALQPGTSQGGSTGRVGDDLWLLVLTLCLLGGLALLSRVLPPTRRNRGVSFLACWGTVMLCGLASGIVDAVLGIPWLQDGTGVVGQFVLMNLGDAVTTGGPAVVLLAVPAAAVYAWLGGREDLQPAVADPPSAAGRPGRVALLVAGLFTAWHLLVANGWVSQHWLWPDGTSLSGFPALLRNWLLFDAWVLPGVNLPWYAWLSLGLQLAFPSVLLWWLLRGTLTRLAGPGGVPERQAFAVALVLVPLAVTSTALPDPLIFWTYASGYPGGIPRLLAVLYEALGAGAVVLPMGLLLGRATAWGVRRWCGPDAAPARSPAVDWRGTVLPALTGATTSAVRGVRGRQWPASWRRGRTDGPGPDEESP